MTNLITKADLQNFAPELDLSLYNDTTISGMISRATRVITNYCQVSGFENAAVTAETDQVRINSDGDLVISVRRRPIESITAIRLKGVNVNVSLTLEDNASNPYYFIPYPRTMVYYPSNFLVNAGAGLISLKAARLFYEIDYVGGYTEIPDDLKGACTLLVREELSQRSNPQGAQSFQQGTYSVTFASTANGAKSKLVQSALDIVNMGDYVRRVI